jgi:hypothetical protein
VDASTERGLGDLGVDGRTEISCHNAVNVVASHGFDSRKGEGIGFLITSTSEFLSASEADKRSQLMFSGMQSNESSTNTWSCKTTAPFKVIS